MCSTVQQTTVVNSEISCDRTFKEEPNTAQLEQTKSYAGTELERIKVVWNTLYSKLIEVVGFVAPI